MLWESLELHIPISSYRMDRVRNNLTRCGGCQRYICCCKTGADDIKLGEIVTGNHLSSYIARKRFRISDFDVASGYVIANGTFWEERIVNLRGAKNHPYLLKSTTGAEVVRRLSQTNHVDNEREVLERLSERNPRIINLFSYFQEPKNGRWHLVLEFVPGGSLEARIDKQGVLNVEDIKFYAAQIYLAIKFLRSERIIHRDVKPSNFFLTERGHLKLSGFTYAKHLRRGERAYTLIGTVNYMAPEVLQGARMVAVREGIGYEGYDGLVDWWSVGACIYKMAQGSAPFSNRPSPELQIQGLEEIMEGQPLQRIRRCVDSRVWDLILKLMNIDVKARQQFAESDELEKHQLFKFYLRESFAWDSFDKVDTYPKAPYCPGPVPKSKPNVNYSPLPDVHRSNGQKVLR